MTKTKTRQKTWLTLKSELKTLRSYGCVTERPVTADWTVYQLSINGQTISVLGEPARNLVCCIEVGETPFRRISQAIEAVGA